LVLEVTDPDRVAILENRVQLTAEQYNFRGPIAGLFEYTSDKTLKGIRKKGGRSIREPISVLTENEKPHFALPAFSLVAGLFVLGGFVWIRYGPAPARPAPADPQRHRRPFAQGNDRSRLARLREARRATLLGSKGCSCPRPPGSR
jgi:hypothetical protein